MLRYPDVDLQSAPPMLRCALDNPCDTFTQYRMKMHNEGIIKAAANIVESLMVYAMM